MPSVVLNKQAFFSMVLASIEVYKQEAFGLLVGRRRGRRIVVENAVAYQSSTRDYDFVRIDERRAKRLDKVLNFLSRHALLGDFHSHPDFPDRLSRHDKKEMLASGAGHVSLLLLVKRARRVHKWKKNKDKSLSGTIGTRHFVKMRAYAVTEDERIVPLRIQCDYMKKLNQFISRYKRITRELERLESLRKSDEARKRKLRRELKTHFSA